MGHFPFVAGLLIAGACDKKPTKIDNSTNSPSGSDAAANTPLDTTPLQGIDVSKLDGDKAKQFYKLVGSLKSPCGKPHSLRTSYATDTSCKRSPFAVRYLVALAEDEVPEDDIRKDYEKKYETAAKTVKLDVSKAPRVGNNDAPVRIVEFFDYSCSHCRDFKPVLDAVTAAHPDQVAEYFMMFPLGNPDWPHSKSAGQAAIAAHAQGKFKPMHAMLFDKAPAHSEADVTGYAKLLGLDLAKFATDYKAAGPQVDADRAQGDAAFGVLGERPATPGVFFNERKYTGPLHEKYIGMWIEEEIAVNR